MLKPTVLTIEIGNISNAINEILLLLEVNEEFLKIVYRRSIMVSVCKAILQDDLGMNVKFLDSEQEVHALEDTNSIKRLLNNLKDFLSVSLTPEMERVRSETCIEIQVIGTKLLVIKHSK